ncbi:MAG: phosphoglycerate kinase [Gammaproteobacteria bacterium]|nr:phosphoglycerate kinase [Gammaproteobacteria bacterium]
MTVLNMTDLELKNKQVVIRVDFNVPIQNGVITSDARIKAELPTIELALQKGAAVILLSHLGRPAEGQFNVEDSLAPVAERLSALLKRPVPLIQNWIDGVTVKPGEVILCENVRFLTGEGKNDPDLAKKMAKLADVFVMDAFATAHRAQASTYGIAEYAPIACAGPLLQAELSALGKAIALPAHPLVALVGGSKVSSKLSILEALSDKVDQLIVGGGIANTFLAAEGFNVGASLYEADLVHVARAILAKLKKQGKSCPLPIDVVVATEFSATAKATIKNVRDIQSNDMILDIGPQSAAQLATILKEAQTIIWNGPLGVFEFPAFSQGTATIARAISDSNAFSLAGGGDTIAAIESFKVEDQISYISTAGGAFLEFLEGKTLPAVSILEKRGATHA